MDLQTQIDQSLGSGPAHRHLEQLLGAGPAEVSEQY